MNTELQIHLFGSLRKVVADKEDLPIRLHLDAPKPLHDVLKTCRIPKHEVQLVMVNHKAVPMDVSIHPGDRLALFAREYPFFPDWNDFRL